MLLILASRSDPVAPGLARCLASLEACLVFPEDLSRAGWVLDLDRPARSSANVATGRVPVCKLRGVLTRLPAVLPADLPHIDAEDREYVASEMTAFLLAWLVSLDCPVVNPPTATSLTGPGWRQENWCRAAAKAGFAVDPVHLRVTPISSREAADQSTRLQEGPQPDGILARPLELDVIGRRVLGKSPNAETTAAAIRLAEIAHVTLLRIYLTQDDDGVRFIGAETIPSLATVDVIEAVADLFRDQRRLYP